MCESCSGATELFGVWCCATLCNRAAISFVTESAAAVGRTRGLFSMAMRFADTVCDCAVHQARIPAHSHGTACSSYPHLEALSTGAEAVAAKMAKDRWSLSFSRSADIGV
jgi:hypothetical protein